MPLRPHGQTVPWTDTAHCHALCGGAVEEPRREPLGGESQAPTSSCLAQLCLLLKLGLPAEGLGFARAQTLHWAQRDCGG